MNDATRPTLADAVEFYADDQSYENGIAGWPVPDPSCPRKLGQLWEADAGRVAAAALAGCEVGEIVPLCGVLCGQTSR